MPISGLWLLLAPLVCAALECTLESKEMAKYAWITPVLGDISQNCCQASQQYISAFGVAEDPSRNLTWGFSQLDANGRLPLEGFLSDYEFISLSLCDLIGDALPGCESLPPSLTSVNLPMPFGFSKNPGSMDICLEDSRKEGFNSRFCTVSLKKAEAGDQRKVDSHQSRSYFGMIDAIDEELEHFRSVKTKSENLYRKNITGIEEIQEQVRNLYSQTDNDSLTIEQIFGLFLNFYATANRASQGMCFPAECTVNDINNNYAELMRTFNIPGPQTGKPLRIETESSKCYTADDKQSKTEGGHNKPNWKDTWIYIALGIIGLMIAIGTFLEIQPFFFSQMTKNKDDPEGVVEQLAKSFSLYSNGTSLLSTKKGTSDHLNCMNGMRFFSMCWVVLGHSFIHSLFGASVRNTAYAYSLFDGLGIAFEVVMNAYPSVDSFFTMGGCLTAYIVFKELDKAGGSLPRHIVTSVLYYVHRYLRLTIPYGLVMGVCIAVLPFLSYGPSWSSIESNAQECRENGWKNLLYINTLTDPKSGCLAQSWYLVCDWIFHMVSLPIMLYPMHLLRRWKGHKASLAYWIIFMTSLTAFVFGINYAFKTEAPRGGGGDIPWGSVKRVSLYDSPFHRYQPYLIGVLLGYILHHTRGKRIEINPVVNIVVWQAAFLAAFAVEYGLHGGREEGAPPRTVFMNAAYMGFQRLAWGSAIAWVIFSCVKGHGGPVNAFLSWSLWSPLSRLTYCCYLIHLDVMDMFNNSALSTFPSDVTLQSLVMYYLGNLVISLAAAALLVLAFEFPFTRVEKILVSKLLKLILGSPSKDKPVHVKETSKNKSIHVKEASNPYSHLSNLGPVVASAALATQPNTTEAKPNPEELSKDNGTKVNPALKVLT